MVDRKEITGRIEALGSWKETIDRIDELNPIIVEALADRSQYPVCRSYFDMSLRRHEEGSPQRELESKGIDTVLWSPFYSKIVEGVCEEGDYAEGVVEAELKLENLVYERIMIGTKVAEYKAQRGLPTTRKEREEKVIGDARAKALSCSLDPYAVADIFDFLIKKNKDIQNCAGSFYSGNSSQAIKSCRTMQAEEYKPGDDGPVERIRRGFQQEADALTHNTGETHIVVVSGIPSNSLPRYDVRLVIQ